MNTLQDPELKPADSMKTDFNRIENALSTQQKIISNFFKTDSGPEMIESLHALVESYLFTENLAHVTPQMRTHIVNQLRVATLIAKLESSNCTVCPAKPTSE